jgi:hypothetical protein
MLPECRGFDMGAPVPGPAPAEYELGGDKRA